MFNEQENEFDNIRLTKLDSFLVNENFLLDEEFSNEIYVDEDLEKNHILRFIEPPQNYLKVSVGNTVFIFPKHERKKLLIQQLISSQKPVVIY